MWFPVFLAPLCKHVLWNLAGSHFQISSPLGEINHFWNKITFLDGSMWFPVFSAPLCLHVIWNLVGSHFQIFSPLGEINHFWNKKGFFRWFHVVPHVFGFFMLKCYQEPSWFLFSAFKPAWWNKSFLEQNSIFFRWFHVVPGVFGSFMLTCYMELSWFPSSAFKPAWWSKSFLEQNHIF